jgi:hypothetical protein
MGLGLVRQKIIYSVSHCNSMRRQESMIVSETQSASPARKRLWFQFNVTQRRLVLFAVLFSIAATWIVGLGCWPLLIWSPLNCRHEDIDITSGRIRYQKCLLGLCVYEFVTDTEMSLLVRPNENGSPAVWRRANTFSPLVHYSPHYSYHAAIYQVRSIEAMWSMASFTPAAKQKIVQNVLFLWQRDGHDRTAGRYLNSIDSLIEELTRSRRGDEKAIDIADLPTGGN